MLQIARNLWQMPSKAAAIFFGTRNPLPIFLDYAGVKRHPYHISTRGGVVFELRPGIGDRFGFYEVAIREDYFSSGQTISAGDTVIDVGANIGCFALLAAQRVGRSGRVIAIEPEEATFRQLKRNIALNHADNVIPLRLAIGGHSGSTTLYLRSESALFSSIYSGAQSGDSVSGSQTVPMTTLENLMSQEKIETCQYLKLDCEGAEYDIVATMTPAVADRISQITMEIHQVESKSFKSLDLKLQELGFRLVSRSGLKYYRHDSGRAAG